MKLSPSVIACALAAVVNAQQQDLTPADGYPKFNAIGGYLPSTQVVEHMSIDLDQAAMEEQLALLTPEGFAKAKRIYLEGGHRRSYAVLNLTEPLGFDLKKDAHFFVGKTTAGKMVTGNIVDDAKVNATQLSIRYTTFNDAPYQGCSVGGLANPKLDGCFASTGVIKMMSNDPKLVYEYTYNPLTANKNPRMIYTFNSPATGNTWHPDYLTAVEYYGTYQYQDAWVKAVWDGTSTAFTNGGADFSGMGLEGRAEAIKTGTVVLHTFMYPINECANHTAYYCKGGSGIPGQPGFTNYAYWKTLHAWDECAAFFQGNLQGVDGTGNGKLVYNMANQQCSEWATCGANGDSTTGIHKVLIDTFVGPTALLAEGRDKILAGNCKDTEPTKNEIAKKWYIPLIQGTMSCAYKLFTSRSETLEAKCATFAAAVLGRVHKASPDDAATIYENTKVGGTATDYQAVWTAFENVYSDLGITAGDIGTYQYTKAPTMRPTRRPKKTPKPKTSVFNV